MPYSLTGRNKFDRVSTPVSLLLHHEKEPFLDRIVAGDEKWIVHDNVRCDLASSEGVDVRLVGLKMDN